MCIRDRYYCTALEQWASAKVCGVVQGMELRNFRRRRHHICLLYTSPSPRDRQKSRMPSSALVYYICIFGGSCPVTEFCQLQNSLCVRFLHSPKLAALLHSTRALVSAKVCGVVQGMELQNFRRGHHLYSARRWASAHILVVLFVCMYSYGFLSSEKR